MKRTIILIVALASVFAGCSEDSKVGSGVDLNIKEAADQGRLGERTTTTVAPTETTAPAAKAGIGDTTTTAKPTTTTVATTTTARQVPTLEVTINPDGGSSQFDPSQARVYAGTLVKWTNGDSVPRSVEADDRSFSSGPIAPGASFTYKAEKAGRFNYHDGTRPYAIGAVEVIGR